MHNFVFLSAFENVTMREAGLVLPFKQSKPLALLPTFGLRSAHIYKLAHPLLGNGMQGIV